MSAYKFHFHTASKKILGDLITPVSAYLKVRDAYPQSALMESSDYHGGENAKSFIALHPIASVSIEHGTGFCRFPDGTSEKHTIGDYDTARLISEFLSSFNIEGNDVSIDIARAGKRPTVSLTGSAGTNTTSMSKDSWTHQLKTNFDLSVGATLSIPILDNRQTKTAVNKARLSRELNLLDLKDKQKTLHNTIETFWINATTNQSKFKAAQVATASQEASYELLSEQFRLGLKNIIELMTGKTNLVRAQQNELESKYTTILNIYMLKFYQRPLIAQ